MEKLKNTKILGILGNVLVIVSLFCTWIVVEAKGFGLRGIAQLIEGTSGKWELVLSILSLIIIFSENIPYDFFKKFTNMKFTLIPTAIQLILVVNNIFKANGVKSEGLSYHFGLGFYLMLLGIIALLAFPFVYKQESKE